MAGFAPIPKRGDGYSENAAREILRADPRFRYEDPEVAADKRRTGNLLNWRKNAVERDVLTESMLFEPPMKQDRLRGVQDWSDGAKAQVCHYQKGYWIVETFWEVGTKGNKRDWQIQCVVAGCASISASLIRKQIVTDLGEDAYARFKQRQWDDLDSLKWCLNQACKDLDRDKAAALSWVTSPSSQRLMERLEIRVEQQWAFLFGHYRW